MLDYRYITQESTNLKKGNRSVIAGLSAWVICPVIMLFSYIPILNYLARGVFGLFIGWFLINIISNKRKFYSTSPIVVYFLWSVYSLIPSIFALDLNLAIQKWITVITLCFVSIAVAHAVIWSGSAKQWILAYVISALFSIVSNYLPIQQYLEVDYSVETFGRSNGTFGNSNTYGRVMVQAALMAILLYVQERSTLQRVVLFVSIAILGYAVVQSESRTALLGYFIALLGGVYSVGWKVFRASNLFKLAVMIVISTVIIIANPEKFHNVTERMYILTGYLGITEKVQTKDRSLNDREKLISKAWNTWLENPMGVGLDNYKLISGVYAHSNYFELLASVGIIGLFIYYLSYWVLYFNIKVGLSEKDQESVKRILLVAIIAIAVMDMSSVSYYLKPLWLMIAIVCGYVGVSRINKA